MGRLRSVTSARDHVMRRTQPGEASGSDFNLPPELYTPVKPLGRGGTGNTWLFTNTQTGEQVAIKFLQRPLPRVLHQSILREFTIQADLGFGHANIVKAYEAILTPSHLCLVMENAGGGSLTAYVASKQGSAQQTGLYLSEDEARYFFRQFISAVKYCHSHHVAHRDLKLDNTLLDDSTPPLVKLCDFGFAKQWGGEDANMLTLTGTVVYMAPELTNTRNQGKGGYDGRSVDVWASGILLLVMLLGEFPFDHTDHPDPNTSEAHLEVWLKQVTKRWSEMPHMAAALGKLSVDVKDLLNRIFVVDAQKRITVEEIEAHPWYCKSEPPQYQVQLDRLQQAQQAIERREGSVQRDPMLVKEREQRLSDMVAEATQRVNPDSPSTLQRIDLRESAVLWHPTSHEEADES